jgi:hypothetical protein
MKNENLLRMEQCPRFATCSIPKCPLDGLMKYRIEFPNEPVCPLRRKIYGLRKARVAGRLGTGWRKLAHLALKTNPKNC